MRILCAVLALTASVVAASPPDGVPEPSVAVWAEALRSGDDAERSTAMTALRALAAGPQRDPATREAAFALADHWLAASDGPLTSLARQALGSVAALYPDDPRSPAVLLAFARWQARAGDAFGAHVSFRQLLGRGDPVEPALLAEAAAIAAGAGDPAAALSWTDAIDLDRLEEADRIRVHVARLEAGAALGRYEIALTAARSLAEQDPELLRTEPRALLAAARTHESFGLLDEAIRLYEIFGNLHPDSPDHPEALLHLGRLRLRVGSRTGAERSLQWLVDVHPDSEAAHSARLELIGLDESLPDAARVEAYVKAMRGQRLVAPAAEACRRLADHFLAAGQPLLAFDTLARVAGEEAVDDIAAIAARQCARDVIGPVIRLLASRRDWLALAVVSETAATLAMPVPAASRDAIDRARAELGLPRRADDPLDGAIASARELLREDPARAAALLEQALRTTPGGEPSPARIEARTLLTEALWRGARAADAVDRAREGLAHAPNAEVARPLRVLLADLLFLGGRLDEACVEYRAARAVESTRWVELQIGRCPASAGSAS